MNKTGLIHNSTELRQLIAENPDLPIVVLAGVCANNGNDYDWMYCSSVKCEVSEILDCETPFNSDYAYSDRYDFYEDMTDYLCNVSDMDEITEKAFDRMVHAEIAKYEPYWKKVILIRADN